MRNAHFSAGLLASLALVVQAVRAQSPLPVGGEFRVNAHSRQQSGELQRRHGRRRRLRRGVGELRRRLPYGVFARRFSSSGAPQAGQFQVNSYTTDLQALIPAGGCRRRRRLRGRVDESGAGRIPRGRLRATVQLGRRRPHRRVHGQHHHRGPSGLAVAREQEQRRLRRGLELPRTAAALASSFAASTRRARARVARRPSTASSRTLRDHPTSTWMATVTSS